MPPQPRRREQRSSRFQQQPSPSAKPRQEAAKKSPTRRPAASRNVEAEGRRRRASPRVERQVVRPIDPHGFEEINTSRIRGVAYGGCQVLVEDKRVNVRAHRSIM
eukprot:COSAG06_NODE_30855_length_531_cov_0.893519_1_plen_104_part_01